VAIPYNDLVEEVAGYLQFDPAITADVERFAIDQCLNASQRNLLNVLPLEWLDFATKDQLLDLVISQIEYDLPAGFVRLVKCWLSYYAHITDIFVGREAKYKREADYLSMADVLRQPSIEYPQVSIIGGKFRVRPVPMQDQSEGFRVLYVAELPKIQTGVDCLVSNNLRNALVFYAVHLSAGIDNFSPELSQRMLQLYAAEIKNIRQNTLYTRDAAEEDELKTQAR
jgi:glucan phosphorylase